MAPLAGRMIRLSLVPPSVDVLILLGAFPVPHPAFGGVIRTIGEGRLATVAISMNGALNPFEGLQLTGANLA